jgi:phosphoribosylamine--glycine ligase
MRGKKTDSSKSLSVMAFGVGSFAHSTTQILHDAGAQVATYLTRRNGNYSPSLVGPTFHFDDHPSPLPLLKQRKVDFVFPQSIDWAQQPWAAELMASKIPILCPTGEAMLLERERDFARRLCREFKIPFPAAHVAQNRLAALSLLKKSPKPYVIKNPLCSPTSPVHTIVCETVEDTRAWLDHVDYAEGVFLQEYLGRAEAGHIAMVSAGEIHSLVTNQEYKRAHVGDLGIVCGAPLGGIVERDPEDKYGLAKALLHPLRPWFKRVNYHGPVQVTACKVDRKWHVIEYNIRLGITSGSMILRLLENPLEVLWNTVRNRPLEPRFRDDVSFGCSMTLAGYGYPHLQLRGPSFPVEVQGQFDCDVWWNEVERSRDGQLVTAGHRYADCLAFAPTLEAAVAKATENIRKIRVLGSYYRTDIGKTLWPPGVE